MRNCRSFHIALRPLLLVMMLLPVAGVTSVYAQLDALSSMYWATPTYYNPAAAGCDSALHITAFDRIQWVSVEGAPRTFFASLDLPVRLGRRRAGLGASVINDQVGLFNTTYVNAQLDFSTKLWGGRLAIGVQPGFVNQAFKGSGISIPTGDAWDANDASLPTGDVSGMAFDLGAGLYYERGPWYGGVAVQHLLGSSLELGEYAYTELKQTYYFHVGGNIPLKRSLFMVHPSVIVRTTWQALQADYTLRLSWNSKFWGGLSYRPGDAIAVMVGADVGHVRLGYCYDVGISRLGRTAGGSHELLATYTMHIDLDKSKKHPHKSIRIL